MEKTTLVWGATGFIGKHLVGDLIASGMHVTVVTRTQNNAVSLEATSRLRVVTIPECPQMAEMLSECVAESQVIFNLAGVSGAVRSNSNPIESLDGNCRIQAMLFRACEIAGNCPHVVFSSSRLVYGNPGIIPVAETAPLFPQSIYAAHKVCIENYHRIAAHRNLMTYTICRISNPYGLNKSGNGEGYGFISDLIGSGLRKEPLQIFGDGAQLRDYVHISDLVRGLRLCAEKGNARNQTFNLGSGHGISIRDAALAIHAHTGAPIVYKAWPDQYAAVESGDYVSDVSLAKSAIGFSPRYSFTEGLTELIQGARSANRQGTRFSDGHNAVPVQVT